MERAAFNKFCENLPATTHVVQWGNADVWKVGGKIFAIGSRWGEDSAGTDIKIAFKCSDLAYQILCEQENIIPAPYLARAKWVQLERKDALKDDEVQQYIEAAHQIIAGKLSKKQRSELGLT